MNRSENETATLLAQAASGDAAAGDRLTESLYGKLREIAEGLLWRRGGQTLQPTAVVHEAYIKMIRADVEDRDHFVALGAKAMRQVIYDYGRKKGGVRHGGGVDHMPLFESAIIGIDRPVDAIEFVELLALLESEHERSAQVVELRFFGGLTNDQVATVLGVSEKTVRNDWRHAKAWLRLELGRGDE